ncbi:MAG: Phosphate regulon transcriptional regulatory protein PhoB [Planctomycetota bacterium]|jgi:two-component system phosphate regulon response regulator PhoB
MINTNRTALVVEDEPEIADLVKFHLEREGVDVTVTRSGRRALELARKSIPDLLVLDLMLPDLDGLEVCRRLKENDETKKIPVVMLTARGSEADIVAGIEMGADDYVTKPFSPRVLMARLQNAMRKHGIPGVEQHDGVLVRCGGKLTIDKERHVVVCNGETISLTITEFEMLFMLAKRPGFVRTRDQIISTVHGPLTVLSQRTIDVHITAIRRKMQDLGNSIETVRGVGYRFSDSEKQ